MGRGPKPAKSKVQGKPPVTRKSFKSPKDDGARVRDLEKRLAEALKLQTEAQEQQAATAEILRVISSSPTDYEPVFNTIVRSAGAVCGAVDAILWTVDGDELVIRAHHGPIPGTIGARQPILGTVAGNAAREARIVQVEDLTEADDFPVGRDFARRFGWRTALGAPLLRDGVAIGAILIRRSEVRPFTEKQIALLQTFADQAVIAIENVRLFTELQAKNQALTEAHAQVTESLEQQTATSEILRVISSSPTDLQPVMNAVAESAARLCEASDAHVFQTAGDLLRAIASHGALPLARQEIPISRHSVIGRAVIDRRPIHVDDIGAALHEFPEAGRLKQMGYRTMLVTPLLREGEPIGAIVIRRTEVRPFSSGQVALLATFADQAVIAIENVRLFNETKEALERQTATSEILQVISSSPTDVQPVFDAIVESAMRLCAGTGCALFTTDGERIYLRAAPLPRDPEGVERRRQLERGRPLDRTGLAGCAILDGAPLHVPDTEIPGAVPEWAAANARIIGFRSALVMPMRHEGHAIGVIFVTKEQPIAFTSQQVALLETFADQAVIAIENVRLFTELQEKNQALTKAHAQVSEALDQQTATSEILRVISQSPTDLQPVLDAVAESAARLCEIEDVIIFRLEGDRLRLAAHHGTISADRVGEFSLGLGPETVGGRAVIERRTIHVADILAAGDEFPESLRLAHRNPHRTIMAVPLLREEQAIGFFLLRRAEVRPFTDKQMALLQTFADQAVIAIENVRLFKELEARTQALTRSVDELTALGEVGRAVSSTLDLETVLSTIVSRAIHLSGTDGGSVYEYDETTEEFSLRASRDLPEAYVEQVRDTRPRKGEGAVGRVAQTREPVQIADISDPATYESRVRNVLLQMGLRALLAVPLIAEDRLVGALIVMRKRTGTFAAEEVALLQTFATQSALAIQNARLFREIEEKSRQLEVASQHKSEFLANMSHELRTPLNAIIGFSEVLSDRMFGELNEKQEEYLKDIYASGTHLLSLINDILDLSKIEAGRMELELSDFDFPTAIDNALMLIRERAGRRSVALHTDIDGRLGQVQADERKVRQVVLNLLSNAIKFTPEGGRIEVRAEQRDGSVEVSVSDTGVGIAPEDQEAVFEEFRQVGTADKKVEGTGLGLTLCRKFVELHGGRIWVKSQVGQGSTFTFTIPARQGE